MWNNWAAGSYSTPVGFFVNYIYSLTCFSWTMFIHWLVFHGLCLFTDFFFIKCVYSLTINFFVIDYVYSLTIVFIDYVYSLTIFIDYFYSLTILFIDYFYCSSAITSLCLFIFHSCQYPLGRCFNCFNIPETHTKGFDYKLFSTIITTN